jgi:hypothetical protein
MKKSYETPTISGNDAVRATKSGGGSPEVGTQGPFQAPGSVGFYL